MKKGEVFQDGEGFDDCKSYVKDLLSRMGDMDIAIVLGGKVDMGGDSMTAQSGEYGNIEDMSILISTYLLRNPDLGAMVVRTFFDEIGFDGVISDAKE